MLQRLRDALRRGGVEQQSGRQLRPNELRQDVVRTERLRREALRVADSTRRPRFSPEEQDVRRAPSLAPPTTPTRPVPQHLSALRTRSGVRHAWLMTVILGPPMALRDSRNGQNDL